MLCSPFTRALRSSSGTWGFPPRITRKKAATPDDRSAHPPLASELCRVDRRLADPYQRKGHDTQQAGWGLRSQLGNLACKSISFAWSLYCILRISPHQKSTTCKLKDQSPHV